MADAPEQPSGPGIDGWFIVFVMVVLLVLWLRGGGWHNLATHKINFGWSQATSTGAFPFAPNFQQLAPRVPIPTPHTPQSPDPYTQ